MKSSMEFPWNSTRVERKRYVTTKCANGWLLQVKSSLRDFIEFSYILKSFLPHMALESRRRIQVGELSDKDKWYVSSGNALRKRIPNRTWSRHSAFLVYRHNLASKYPTNDLSVVENSSRQLPIWATALSEIELIESDVSSLRYISIVRRVKATVQNNIAHAA